MNSVQIITTLSIIFIGLVIFLYLRNKRKKWIEPEKPFPKKWKKILKKNVEFYAELSKDDQSKFEFKVQEFLLNCKVTGVKTRVTLKDKILVASSAIIPIFEFKDWKYNNINEVILYPARFNKQYQTDGSGNMDRKILGMVGTGSLDNTMILSKKALRQGFQNKTNKKNTAIHEFVHLIDKRDGSTDGIPENLLGKQYTIPWIKLMNKKMQEIYDEESDINPYAGTNEAEFFAVSSEYFFERPKLLEKKHPKLYKMLDRIFSPDNAS